MSGPGQYGALDDQLRQAFVSLIEERTGLLPRGQQLKGVDAAVTTVMAEAGCATPQDFYGAVRNAQRSDLVEAVAARLTVGETHFFRVGPQLDALRRVILPDLIAKRAGERRLSIWSAGCSTGEEPYTLAILLREALPAPDRWKIDVLGTDINEEALKRAQRGLYGPWSFRDTPDYVRDIYFHPRGPREWELKQHIREMVRFVHMNLIADAMPVPHTGDITFDLILCRNVTIYFSSTAAHSLYRRFARMLPPDGWLVLGPSDLPPTDDCGLERRTIGGAIVWRPRGIISSVVSVERKPVPQERHVARTTRSPAVPLRRAVTATYKGNVQGDNAPSFERARDFLKKGDRHRAVQEAQRLSTASPASPRGHLLLGMLHLEAGETSAALESLRRAAFLDSSNPLAHFALGRAYVLEGHRGRARAELLHARRLLEGMEGVEMPGPDADIPAEALAHTIDMTLAGLSDRAQS